MLVNNHFTIFTCLVAIAHVTSARNYSPQSRAVPRRISKSVEHVFPPHLFDSKYFHIPTPLAYYEVPNLIGEIKEKPKDYDFDTYYKFEKPVVNHEIDYDRAAEISNEVSGNIPKEYTNRFFDSNSEEFNDFDDKGHFIDLTRDEGILTRNKHKKDIRRGLKGFSTDYLDIHDLSRSATAFYKPRKLQESGLGKRHRNVYYRRNKTSKHKGKYVRESFEGLSELSDEEPKRQKKSRVKVPKRFAVVDHKKRKVTSDISTTSDEIESAETDTDTKRKVLETYANSKSEDNVQDSEERETVQRKKGKRYEDPIPDVIKTEIYIQAPGRFLQVGPKSKSHHRRRLQHFLPKRYHWNEDDFKKLGYSWFNGPQGKHAGIWRLNY